ncbi:hypothetical protein D3C85_149800 [compost metagenome]|jgi:hypothetical protein
MNAHYRLYIKSTLKLAATLLIKSASTADLLNTKVAALGYEVDRDNPYTWKYYLNMAGMYHEADTEMTVISLDTQEEISFDTVTLAEHRGTKREYGYGSVYYKDLVARYPDQQALINGILNPVDIETAVTSEDHKILWHDKKEVEEGEEYLIPRVQRYIDMYFLQRDNRDFTLFEPFYYTGLMGVLYTKLPLWIITLRKEMCKTDYVHTFYVRQYLTSFSAVGKEFDYMTRKLRLWLYRNIRYLNRNLGREEILKLTTEKVLTDRGFNLSGFKLSHVYEHTPATLKPEVELQQETLNGIEPANGATDKSVGEMLDMELGLARGNIPYRDDSEIDVTKRSVHAKNSTHITKILDSNVLDRADADPFTLTDVLLNHWLYLAHFGRYNTVLSITNPSNGDTFKLSAKNAFIFYIYAYNKAIGITLDKVPVLSANRVRRMPLPTFTELRKLAEKKRVPDYALHHLLTDQAPITRYVSVEAFRELCVDIHRKMLDHRKFRCYYQDWRAEGQLHTVVDRFYQDIRIDLAKEQSYDSWLNQMGIDTTAMGRVEYQLMYSTIFNSITGADLSNVNSVRQIHASMIRIMQALSSYSVQYIKTINDNPVKIVDGKFPKQSIPKLDETEHKLIDIDPPTILDVDSYERRYDKIKANVGVDFRSTLDMVTGKIPVVANIKLLGRGTLVTRMDFALPTLKLIPEAVTDITGDRTLTLDYLEPERMDYADLFLGASFPIMTGGYDALTDIRRKMFLGL